MSMYDELILPNGKTLQTKEFECVGATYKIEGLELYVKAIVTPPIFDYLNEAYGIEDIKPGDRVMEWQKKEFTGVLTATTHNTGVDIRFEDGEVEDLESFSLV